MAKRTPGPPPRRLPAKEAERPREPDAAASAPSPFGVPPAFALGVRGIARTQLKGVDALAAANQIALESALAVAECQCRALQEAWGLVLSASGCLFTGGLSPDGVDAQAEWARRASEKFLSDGRALASLVGRAGVEVVSVWRERLAEMIDEIERLSRSEAE